MNKRIVAATAISVLMTVTAAVAYPGRIIIAFEKSSMAISDEGTIYADDLVELGMAGVSSVAITVKVTSDTGRIYEAQIADGTDCVLQYDATGAVEAVECTLDDR